MEKRALILGAAASLAFFGWPIAHGSGDGDVQTLFNGKDLTGWEGDRSIWSVQAGAITGQTTEQNPLKENTSLVWQGGTPANFELRVSFRLVAKNDKNFANSGIYYRSRADAASKQVLGYQGGYGCVTAGLSRSAIRGRPRHNCEERSAGSRFSLGRQTKD
jgi:Domain of Unknown Function (DUF1080)